MDKTLDAILIAADDDLTALVNAVVQVVERRHYDQRGAQDEIEQVIAYLRAAVSRGARAVAKAAVGADGLTSLPHPRRRLRRRPNEPQAGPCEMRVTCLPHPGERAYFSLAAICAI
jgi:hypothetical protein